MGAGARSRPVHEPELDFGVANANTPGIVHIKHVKCGRWVHNVSITDFAFMAMGHKCDQGTGSW